MSKKVENTVIGQIFEKQSNMSPSDPKSNALSAIDEGDEPISKDFEAQAEISGIRSGQMSTEIQNINNKSSKKLSNKKQIEELNDKLLKENQAKDLLNLKLFEQNKELMALKSKLEAKEKSDAISNISKPNFPKPMAV